MKRRKIRAGLRTHASGFTLLEMAIAFSLTSVLLSLGVVLLGLFMRADSAGHEALGRQLSISRLERQFREDAHQALAVTGSDDGRAVEFRLGEHRRAVWSVRDTGVERAVHEGESRRGREEFQVTDAEASFSSEPDGQSIELRFVDRRIAPLETPSAASSSPPPTWRIQAVIGLTAGPAVAVKNAEEAP